MKKIWISLLLAMLFVLGYAGTAMAFEVNAAAAILIDASSGRVIYELNPHESLAPASTTKILTALVALEQVEDLSQQVTLPDDFVNVGESGIYLEPGETQTLEDLLYALMLRSANDAGQAIAIGVAGSEPAFVELMNARTEELGLTDSHWANPHGLDAEDHYTSAFDLAMITREALTIPKFNELIVEESWTMPWESNDYDRTLYNHNQFLDLYEGADGVKTGYTSKSGSCLVASATRDGLRLIGVVLNCDEHYQEMCNLMDYGFATFTAVKVAQAGDIIGSVRVSNGNVKRVDAVLGADVSIMLEKGSVFDGEPVYEYDQTLEAPIEAGQEIGTARFVDTSGVSVEVPICVRAAAERYTFGIVWKQVWQALVSALLGGNPAVESDTLPIE